MRAQKEEIGSSGKHGWWSEWSLEPTPWYRCLRTWLRGAPAVPLSPSSRGSSAAGRAPARKLAESEHSISVSFGRAIFYKLWLSAIIGDDLWINKELHTLGETKEARKKTGTHFSGGFAGGHRRSGSQSIQHVKHQGPRLTAPAE